jgi:hypothetical protein
MNEITFTYQKARMNNVDGYIATKWENGAFVGKQFGKTKKAAREAFDFEVEDYFS